MERKSHGKTYGYFLDASLNFPIERCCPRNIRNDSNAEGKNENKEIHAIMKPLIPRIIQISQAADCKLWFLDAIVPSRQPTPRTKRSSIKEEEEEEKK